MSNVVRCSHAMAMVQGIALAAERFNGSMYSLNDMTGVLGALLVARRSASVGGSSDAVKSLAGLSVSAALSVLELEQSSVVAVATDLVSLSCETVGIGGLSRLSLVDWSALGWA